MGVLQIEPSARGGTVLAGYHGRYVRVDAATGTLSSEALAPAILRRFVGGVGLGTWILAVETEPGTDPLAEQSALVFALSPLVGTPLTTSAKFALVAISPLTGRICDALSSSHFALAAKRAGVDAIVITGRRAEPSIVFIEGNPDGSLRVIWQPAAALWGLAARQAEEQIRARHGADWQVAAIGPAGERLIPFATISHDGRHAGRGGLGAILGSFDNPKSTIPAEYATGPRCSCDSQAWHRSGKLQFWPIEPECPRSV